MKSRKMSKAKEAKEVKEVKEVRGEELVIRDVGNKEVRDRQDCKAIWAPNELRADIVSKVREQIRAAFGAEIEAD